MSVGADWNPASAGYVDLEKQSLDIWALVLRRKWLILFMLLTGLGLGYLFYVKATRWYEASAKLLITERRGDSRSELAPVASDSSYARMTNHIQLIKSPVVVQMAVDKHRLYELPSFEGVQRPNVVGKILTDLESIRAGGREAVDSNIMEISYRSTSYVNVTTVLRAIIDSYRDYLGEAYQSVNADFVQLMSQAKDSLAIEKRIKDEELEKLGKDSPPGVPKSAGELSSAEINRRSIVADRQRIDSQRAKLRAMLKTIESYQTQGSSTDIIMSAIEDYRKSNDAGMAQDALMFADNLFQPQLELQQLTAKFGPQHPEVKAVELKIQLIRQRMDEQIMIREASKRSAPKTPEQFIAMTIGTLQFDLSELDNTDKELAEQQAKAEKESQFLAGIQRQFVALEAEIDTIRELHQVVFDRLKQINLMKDAGGINATDVAKADGAMQVEPKLWKALSIAGFFGLALGMGLAYLVDLADKSFRNPEEVRHELGVPILGHLPVIVGETRRKKKDAPTSPIADIVCTHHRPKSTYSEAYRAVRTALNFGIRGEGHKVIQVTSPDPGDGKSTLTGNLAVCMAQSGRRVLLVDADFRRPRVHKMFGVEPGLGMSAVIKGTADLPEVIVPTDVDNLFLLPCGPRPSNPSELLSSTRFSELIHVLREQYDIVLIDTPPVLAVTDPCVVAPRVDGVVLLIRITKHVRPHAKRALEALESLGANLIGIVVNGVGGNRPGMGYGFGSQYGYRYATNSGYYDSYSYNYGGYHHYYEDGDTPTEEQVLRDEGYVRSQPPDDRT